MFIQILVDNVKSWIIPFAEELRKQLILSGHKVALIYKASEVIQGDILCLLGCENIFKKLDLNKHNLVVHESNLPKGKGWSPLTWQIIEGANKIPVTLFEADNKVDNGLIYDQKHIELTGYELIDQIRYLQGKVTIQLILEFIQKYPNVKGIRQSGKSTYYRKRELNDSELDVDKTIREQFNLLRIVDNERYPAFFEIGRHKYKIKIEPFK